MGFYGGAFPPSTLNGEALQESLWRWSQRGMEAPPTWVSHVTIWTKVRAQVLLVQRKEESVEQVPVEGGIPPEGAQ